LNAQLRQQPIAVSDRSAGSQDPLQSSRIGAQTLPERDDYPGSIASPAALNEAVTTTFLAERSLLEYVEAPPSNTLLCMQFADPMTAEIQQNVFDHLDFHPAAIRSAFTHENIVKMAHNFVPGQSLPDAPSYVPLSSRQKFDRFQRSTHSVDTLVGAGFDSLYSQATGAYPQFGGGMGGYGRRYSAALAGAEAGAFFGKFLFPTLLHQDPRYFPSHQNDISNRLAYAASRVLITRSDDGRNVLNTSLILSELMQAALSNAYIPYRNETVSGTLENAAASLGSVAQDYILKEFWPDIKGFLGKHQPARVRRIRERWDEPSPKQNVNNGSVAIASR
jgi:hypothetical protein